MRAIKLGLAAFLFAGTAVPSSACELAAVLFGDIELSILPAHDYETAIVRHNNFDNQHLNYGSIKGEITVDRGGFAIRNANQVVIGTISPELEVESWEDTCDKSSPISISRIKKGVYVLTMGDKPLGTIEGRFPRNSFGVE